jgi:multifunctional beta-oxidation protein
MTRTVWPEKDVLAIKPDYVAPVAAALCSERPPATGQIFESGCGWIGATRWQRARGVDFDHDKGVPSVEKLAEASISQLRVRTL